MSKIEDRLTTSDLNKVIDAEILDDQFHDLIKTLSASENIATVLEIGSSAGGGSTNAFVAGLAQNKGCPKLFCIEISKPRFNVLQDALAKYDFVHCYNRSSVRVEDFPSPRDVIRFYDEVDSGLRKFPIAQVLSWLQQDIDYVNGGGVDADAIETIKADHGIDTFDMVLIDGSEFTGMAEFAKVDGAHLILLDDTNTFKCYHVRQHLLQRSDYELIADDQTLRNGFSAFRRRGEPAMPAGLPIHFFTIVLNGEPFIRYHIDAFKQLDVPWHWHIVEGVAELKHDTAWSVAAGGRVADSVHDRGRSNDGTSAYLDELAARYPTNVSLYRKPLGTFWDGKREMVGAPLPKITTECLLWQVDADELWTVEQISTVHRMFEEAPERSAAKYWCWYFVGPSKIISTRYNYAQNPMQEWLRTWRFKPGDHWFAHEPPILVRDIGAAEPADVAKINSFEHDETEQAGAVFQHYAYAIEAQLAFKEIYYGYADARKQWQRLQASEGSGLLKNFLAWVPDQTMFDDVSTYPIDLVAICDQSDGTWHFRYNTPAHSIDRVPATNRPRIMVDGIFWQYNSSGIARVWSNLLHEWLKTGFNANVVVLDRAGTAPRIPGIHYWTIAKHDYRNTGGDSLYLERVCQQFKADIFISTYYSSPTATPSVFAGYDMIPEKLGFDISGDEAFHEKRRAIRHAAAHIMISANSAADLESLYPEVGSGRTHIAHCGTAPSFFPPSPDEIERFRSSHDLASRPYVLMIGERLGYQGSKNGDMAFIALERLQPERPFTLVCTGGADQIEPQLTRLAPSVDVRHLRLDDDGLRAALGGALALIYPSLYEGFGLPVLEAMACGCPAVVCRNSSLVEVVGDAGLFAKENDPGSFAELLIRLLDPAFRREAIEAGYAQARRFSFADMAETFRKALVSAHEASGDKAKGHLAWMELREQQTSYAISSANDVHKPRSPETIADGDERISTAATAVDDVSHAIRHEEASAVVSGRHWFDAGSFSRLKKHLSDWRWLYPGLRHLWLRRRLNAIDEKHLAPMNDRLGTMDERLWDLGEKFASIDSKLSALSHKIQNSVYREDFIKKFEEYDDKRLAAGFALAATRFSPVDRAYQFRHGLKAVGVLNYEDDWISGERRFIALLLQHYPEATIMDIGANVGRYGQAARRLGPKAKIYCFEPHPTSFSKLQAMSATEGIDAFQLAVGDIAGEIDIFDYSDEPGSEHASVYKSVIEDIHQRPSTSHRVRCDTVDNIVRELKLDHVSLLKVDTEGHEFAVLKGASEIIGQRAVDYIQFEFNEMNVFSRVFMKDFFDLLDGYNLYRLLPDSAIHLSAYNPVFMEVFAYQNIVAVRAGLDATWLSAQDAFPRRLQ